MIAILLVILNLTAVTAVAGCSRAGSPPPAPPRVPFASLDQTATAGPRQYRVRTNFMGVPSNREILVAILDFADFGDPPLAPGKIVLVAYGSDGKLLDRPKDVGISYAGTIATPTRSELAKLPAGHARSWGDIPFVFAVRKGESNVTIEAMAAGRPEVRWRVR